MKNKEIRRILIITILIYFFISKYLFLNLNDYLPKFPATFKYKILKIRKNRKKKYILKVKFKKTKENYIIKYIWSDGNYKILKISLKGIYILKDIDEDGSWWQYQQPFLWLPRFLPRFSPLTFKSKYLQFYLTGRLETKGEEKAKWIFLKKENNVIKLLIIKNWKEEKDNLCGVSYITLWLAKKIGIIKENEVFIKFKDETPPEIHYIKWKLMN